MPLQELHYNQSRFWTPANASGKAATVNGELDGKPIRIHFYWTGMALVGKPLTAQQLQEEASKFLQSYHPKHVNDSDLHFVRDGVDFKRILDPGWIPGY